MSVSTDGFSKLSVDENKRVVYVVAFLVESGCFELVLWGPEKFLNSDGITKNILQELQLIQLYLIE